MYFLIKSIGLLLLFLTAVQCYDELEFWSRDPRFDVDDKETTPKQSSDKSESYDYSVADSKPDGRRSNDESDLDSDELSSDEKETKEANVKNPRYHIEMLQSSKKKKLAEFDPSITFGVKPKKIRHQLVDGKSAEFFKLPKKRQFAEFEPLVKIKRSRHQLVDGQTTIATTNATHATNATNGTNVTAESAATKEPGRAGEAPPPGATKPGETTTTTKTTAAATAKVQDDTDVPRDTTLKAHAIAVQMIEFAKKMTEANITQEIIGKTVSFNDIVLLKITLGKSEVSKMFGNENDKFLDESEDKKIIFIVHNLNVMGSRLLPCLSNEEGLKELLGYYFKYLDKFDIYLIPMANPDGFVQSRSASHWNKNVAPLGACAGVNLDRNFDIAWDSRKWCSPCSQHYPGTRPFSEPESEAIRKILHKNSNKIVAYLNVHSGTYDTWIFKGDAILYPKGYTDVTSEDDKYIDLRGEVEEALKNGSFRVISVNVDTLYSWYGRISGSSVDYASGVYGIPYTMELVMQPYERYAFSALTDLWSRVLKVIFDTIVKSQDLGAKVSNDNA